MVSRATSMARRTPNGRQGDQDPPGRAPARSPSRAAPSRAPRRGRRCPIRTKAARMKPTRPPNKASSAIRRWNSRATWTSVAPIRWSISIVAAMGVERGAGGEHDGRRGRADHQQDEPGREPFERADQRGERRQPLAVVVDPRRGRGGGDRAGAGRRARGAPRASDRRRSAPGPGCRSRARRRRARARAGACISASGTGRTAMTPGRSADRAPPRPRPGRGAGPDWPRRPGS